MVGEKKAELLARRAKREEEARAAKEARELEALELEDKFAIEGRTLGLDFLVVSTSVGNFVVMNPDFVVGKQFSDKTARSIEDASRFVTSCIAFPDRAAVGALFQAHGGLVWTLSAAALRLFHAQEEEEQGK